MTEQSLRAGERRTAADGDLLALSPLPVSTGARPADPADWIRRKNAVWMDLQGGNLVFAAELSLMFLSLSLITIGIGFFLSAESAWRNNSHFDWWLPGALIVGNVLCSLPFALVFHYNTNKAIKEGPPVRLNRQKREVAVPRWLAGREVKFPFWGEQASVFIYLVYLITFFFVISAFMVEGPVDDRGWAFFKGGLLAFFIESLIFIPYIAIGLHLHKKHKPRLQYVYYPWEQLVAYVQKQQDIGPSIFTERTLLTLAIPDPDNPETALAAASIAVGHETAGLAQWESIRRFMEDGPEACPGPRDYGTLAHYRESCRKARAEMPLVAWLWKKVGDWFFQRNLAHRLTERRVNHLIPKSLPAELQAWSQPLSDEQHSKPSAALLEANRRAQALRRKNRGISPQAVLEMLHKEAKEGDVLLA
ncbi:hypothetical protein [Marinobacter profundi]|uniref:hypothetical protein n=1 Tax=Marinobacter profundi TaxID=2666256 RepID=UPI00117F36AC|nr:hypothetical protein [Marinobacter profundi]